MRLITRADFDGLACAALLEEIGIISDYSFVHPKDVQDGKIEVGKTDVLANVPYAHGCCLWFDHHSSEMERLKLDENYQIGRAPRLFNGVSRRAPSCARVIYDFYGGEDEFEKFDHSGLMAAIDRSDSGKFTRKEILEPEGWVLLSFIMDQRTGLEKQGKYRINREQFMRDMIRCCREMEIDEILAQPDVKERVDSYFRQEELYRKMLLANCRTEKNILILDLRELAEIPSGNRFIEYALFPEQNISIRTFGNPDRGTTVFTVGHSILNRTSKTNVGSLMLEYGGGGHDQVGTCQVLPEEGDRVFTELIDRLVKDG